MTTFNFRNLQEEIFQITFNTAPTTIGDLKREIIQKLNLPFVKFSLYLEHIQLEDSAVIANTLDQDDVIIGDIPKNPYHAPLPDFTPDLKIQAEDDHIVIDLFP